MASRINPDTGEVWDLVDGRWVPRSGAAEDLNPIQAALVGTGARFHELGQGVENIVAGLTGDEQRQAELEVEAAERRRLMAPLEAQYPTATTIGAMLPDLATAPLTGGSGLLGRAAFQGGLGALSGALGYREGGAFNQVLEGGAVGAGFGAGGSVVGSLGGRMAARVGSRIQQMARRMGGDLELRAELPEFAITGRADVEDVGLTATQRQAALIDAGEDVAQARGASATGRGLAQSGELSEAQRWAVREGSRQGWIVEDADLSRPLGMVREGLESHPLTAGLFSANREANRQTLVNKLGEALGIGPGELTPERLGLAAQNVENLMDQVHTAAGRVNARAFKSVAEEVAEGGKRGLVGSEATDIANAVKAQLENSTRLDPAEATVWRSQINDAFRRATSPTGRPDAFGAENLSRMQEALDNAIQEALPRAQKPLYKQARDQWRLLTALRKGAALRPDGQVNIPTLANNLRRTYRSEYGLGRDSNLGRPVRDALRLVRVANTLDTRIGDSGTATRLALQNMTDSPVQSIALAFGARPLGAVVGAATRVDPGVALGATMQSPELLGAAYGGAVGRGIAAGAGL